MRSFYYMAEDMEENRIFLEVSAIEFECALDKAFKACARMSLDFICIDRTQNGLAETIYCIDNDC